jgi:hypothetical protein
MKFGKRLKLEAGALGITHAVLDYGRMKKARVASNTPASTYAAAQFSNADTPVV